jgi:hypothetical protein
MEAVQTDENAAGKSPNIGRISLSRTDRSETCQKACKAGKELFCLQVTTP